MSKKYKFEKTLTYDGKRYHIYGDTLEEVIEKKTEKLRDLKENKVILSGSMTVAQWIPRCLDAYKPNISDEYRSEMELRINKHIISRIGAVKLSAVKPLMCQEILNAQIGMSKSHITKLHQELAFIFEKAYENQLILTNPASHLTRPEGVAGERRSLTQTEREHFLTVSEAEPSFILFLLMLYCGCRPAEAMNACGSDIIEIEGVNVLHIRGTKTKNSDRHVPIPDELFEKIKDTPADEPIAKNHVGKAFGEPAYRRAVSSLKRAMNISMGAKLYRNKLMPPLPLDPDFTPYMLRHTYCTDLQKMGVDVRAAQKFMGHADISTTANIYTHQDNETLLQAAAIMKKSREEVSNG